MRDSAPPDPWSPEDWDRINVTDIFIHKPRIMKQAETQLALLRERMVPYLKETSQRYPAETDIAKGQIARGENNKGFPFVSLDIPQKFNKTEFFTFRSLFWWGHYLGFSLILKGPDLRNQAERLIARRTDTSYENLQMACTANPWEWELGDDNFKSLQSLSDDQILKMAEALQYFKILRVHPLQEDSFKKLDWTEAGVQAFKQISDLVLE